MHALNLIAVALGIYVAAAVIVVIWLRALWVRETYGTDLALVDRVEAVMTPNLWVSAGAAILLIGLGVGFAS